MKKIFLTALILFSLVNLFAIETVSVIKEVIVYQNEAKITHEAVVTVPAGNSEVVIGGITSYLQQNTLQANMDGSAIILSASSRLNYTMPKDLTGKLKNMRDSLNLIENQLRVLSGEKQVYTGEEKMINENNKLGSEQKGVEVTELKLLADFYRTRLMEIKKQIISIEEKEKLLQEIKNRLQNQLNEANAVVNQPVAEVVLNVSASIASKVKIRFSYLVNSAGWAPLYDIRSENTDKPIQVIYKANVFQSTGYDWKDIRLSISTGNPQTDQNRPVLNPWYIDFYSAYIQEQYNKKSAPARSELNMMMEVEARDEAVMPAPQYIVTENKALFASEYVIENLQSIPSDGKEHLVAMKEYEIKAGYTYHSVPKLSDGVFLLAELVDFGEMNLIPGNANLFNAGMYVGQTYVDPFVTDDTLLISLGRDEKISVKRNVVQDLTSKQVIGNNKKETKSFDILIKNNKNIPVEIEILDNIPISQNKEIEVSLEESGGASYSPDYGKLLWKVKLNGGESKKIRFSFSVKYPKDRQIEGI